VTVSTVKQCIKNEAELIEYVQLVIYLFASLRIVTASSNSITEV